MNIEQANTIPLPQILDKINLKPARETNTDAWYLSPLRGERTASFHVSKTKNLWYDHGTGEGGDVVKFVCRYLEAAVENHTVADALRWLRNMMGNTPTIATVNTVSYALEDRKLVLRHKKDIEHPALIEYLKQRGIPLTVGKDILKEVRVYNTETKKVLFGLGLRNEDAGYEIRNPFFKGCVGTKSVKFVRGTKPKPDGINIFEGFMDYLSIITHQNGKKFEDDTIILNSLSCLKKAAPYIYKYGYKNAYTWMDNDEAGKKATQSLADYFKTENMLEHIPMNIIYEPHKDVNAWLMNKLGLEVLDA